MDTPDFNTYQPANCTGTVGTAPQVYLAHSMNPDRQRGAGFFRVEVH